MSWTPLKQFILIRQACLCWSLRRWDHSRHIYHSFRRSSNNIKIASSSTCWKQPQHSRTPHSKAQPLLGRILFTRTSSQTIPSFSKTSGETSCSSLAISAWHPCGTNAIMPYLSRALKALPCIWHPRFGPATRRIVQPTYGQRPQLRSQCTQVKKIRRPIRADNGWGGRAGTSMRSRHTARHCIHCASSQGGVQSADKCSRTIRDAGRLGGQCGAVSRLLQHSSLVACSLARKVSSAVDRWFSTAVL